MYKLLRLEFIRESVFLQDCEASLSAGYQLGVGSSGIASETAGAAT